MKSTPTRRRTLAMALPTLVLCACGSTGALQPQTPSEEDPAPSPELSMQIQYLEIVTPEVDQTCAILAAVHGTTFGDPIPGFGNARAAAINGGGRIGVRAPMAEHETPVVRPYLHVEDIEAAIAAAEAEGAQFAMKATPIPGEGTFAIYMLGGIQHGLWQD